MVHSSRHRVASSDSVDPEALRAARKETVARESRRNLRIGSLVVAGVMLIEGVGHVFTTPERTDLIVYPLGCALVCGSLGALARRHELTRPEWWFLVPWLAGLGTTIQHIPHEPMGAAMFLTAAVMVVSALVLGTGPLIIALSTTSVAFVYAVLQAFGSYQWIYPAVTLPMAGLIFWMRRARLKEADRRRLAERALSRQQAELEGLRRSRALAEGVSHHFNNLLMVILSHGTVALEDAPEQSALQEDLEAVVQAGQRAAELVQGLIGTTGVGPANIRRVSLAEILDDLPVARPVTVVREQPGPAAVRADLDLLRAALTQVVDNAIEVTPEAEEVVLRVSPLAPRRVRFAVEDGGPGFSAESLARGFEPFFTTRDPTRAGLGLAFAKGVVEQLGGAIEVSERPGGGAVVSLAFELES